MTVTGEHPSDYSQPRHRLKGPQGGRAGLAPLLSASGEQLLHSVQPRPAHRAIGLHPYHILGHAEPSYCRCEGP